MLSTESEPPAQLTASPAGNRIRSSQEVLHDKKGGSPVGERELTVEYKGDSDPDLDAVLKAALKPFGYKLRDKGYDPKSRVRDLRFLKEA
jgi:hypothetical protein